MSRVFLTCVPVSHVPPRWQRWFVRWRVKTIFSIRYWRYRAGGGVVSGCSLAGVRSVGALGAHPDDIGIAAGGLSGFLGIGGGVLMVPAFTTWLRVPIKVALATSLACVGVLAIPGMLTHAALGHIDWLFALPLSVTVIPGARLGAHLTIRSSDRTLRLLVGVVLGLIATAYAVGEVLALF